LVIEPLSDHHNRLSFDCGIPRMNEFLQKIAKQHAAKDVGVTHVVIESDGDPKIVGFVTLTIKPINRESLLHAKKFPQGEYTVAFIGQFAIDKEYQGKGIGKQLLSFALYKALEVSDVFGIAGVGLDLHQEEGESPDVSKRRRKFYTDRGFRPLIDDSQRLFISMKEVRRMGLR
jgi:GNAT superfamily N-acetyltransferase